METMTYRLSDFEGPLDLLLALIEKNKLNILDIPIALICDQYLEFLAQARAMDMDIATDFLNMASKLMMWKSEMLLPHEDEDAEKPPRFDLSDILIRHQHAKEVLPKLFPLYAYFGNRFVKDTDEISPDKTFVAQQEITDLLSAVRRVNSYRDTIETVKTAFTPMVSKPVVPVEGKIVSILETLRLFGTATLRDLLVDEPSLADLVAAFMGVLELIKMRRILIEDEEDAENSVHGENTRFFLNPDDPAENAEEQSAAKE